MKKNSNFLVLLIGFSFYLNSAFADTLIHDESELGLVITTGNSKTQSYNLKQKNQYAWDLNALKFEGRYLDTSANSNTTARTWNLGLRYERELSNLYGVFVGQNIESDIFSGYNQRYNTDIGGKYFIYKEEAFDLDFEAGYRYTIENRLSGQVKQNYLRFYTEANRKFSSSASMKLDVEYLRNLTVTSDFQINSEVSVSAILNEIFSVKTAYLVKYRNFLPPPATVKVDTQTTTALVAKF